METPTPYLVEYDTALPRQKRAELWRQFTAHLIGLATVLWWVWFKEAPPK